MSVCEACQGTGRTTPRTPLTERQKQVLDWIREYIALNGVAPTYVEIRDAFGFRTLSTVHEHVDNLRRGGWITHRYNRNRSIQIVGEE